MYSETNIIHIPENQLSLTHSLTPGQSFRWKMDSIGRWTGVIGKKVVRIWRKDDDILYQIFPGGKDDELILSYFRMDVNLDEMYKNFSEADDHIRPAIERFRGLRILRQEPEETLLSYICSAANSVTRISKSVESMSRQYGEFIADVDGCDYYSFPSAEALSCADVEHMGKSCNLGFRCTGISYVAKEILARQNEWLSSLRKADYEKARRDLLSVKGVGMKIADCVLLFAMDKDEAVPVDTHVRQVATKYYLPEFEQKTLTPAVYRNIVEAFQQKFGQYAGWAQEYLFYDDLLRRTAK